MFEQELTYQDLHIPSSEIYEAMGYKDSIPDPMVIEETGRGADGNPGSKNNFGTEGYGDT